MADFDIGRFITSLFDLSEGVRGAGQNRGATAADIADPFRNERGQYQDQLAMSLLAPKTYEGNFQEKDFDGGTYHQSPGYQWALSQGLEGVNRTGNAMFGTTRAGNTALSLIDYNQGAAQADYDKWRDDTTKNRSIFNQEQDARRSADVNRSNIFGNQQNSWIDALLTASGAKTGSPAVAADAYNKGFAQDDTSNAAGANQIGNLLTGLLGLGGNSGPAMDWIKGLLGLGKTPGGGPGPSDDYTGDYPSGIDNIPTPGGDPDAPFEVPDPDLMGE